MSLENKVRKVEPYVAGEQPKDPNIIKLNTNECPYPPSPAVVKAVEQLGARVPDLRLYPDMNATMLVDALAKKYGLESDQIFVGVGSDDVLALCFLTFFSGGEELVFPDITYSFYKVWAELYRIPYRAIPLTADFRIDPFEYNPTLTKRPNGGVIFPNPNAPTGVEEPQEVIERILRANKDSVVIVDEAYIDFGGTSAVPLIEKYDNLLVVQTFSKSRAMAGARIGFAMGNKKLIKYLKDVKFSFNSYTMSLPTILIGTAAVEDDAYFQEITGRIQKTREWFEEELTALGFDFQKSMTNFVFARHPKMSGDDLFAALRERGIVVRHWNAPYIEDYLRITIGTDEQMEKVVEALKQILADRA